MKQLIDPISKNYKFEKNELLKLHLSNSIGLRLLYPEGTQAILWTNGKKYYLACEIFGETITINIPQAVGDDIYDRFKTRFEGNYSIKYV